MLNFTTTYVPPGAHLLRIENLAIFGKPPHESATFTLVSRRYFSGGPMPTEPAKTFTITYGLSTSNLRKMIQATGRMGVWSGEELNVDVFVGAKVLAIVTSSPVPGDGYEVHLTMVGSAHPMEPPKENIFTRQARRQGLLTKGT
ncbi:MAG: hypothetical protein IPO09_02380 [Anaeromyxobacter sp.]|nr:hypothetical protein [Anaeromyxobacter sp.]